MAEDNRNYEIEVDIYNMEFGKKGFTHDNIEFIPYADYKARYEMLMKKHIHWPTGTAKISLLAENCDEAIKKAERLLSDYGRLLTFAQDHDVFFYHYECYEVNNGNRAKKGGQTPAVLGVVNPFGMSNIRPPGIEEFIKTAIPLIRDKEYVEKTGIYRAISWFIVANQRHIKNVPTVYPIFWIVLEMLANVHAKVAGNEFITSEDAFKIIKNKIESIIEKDLVLFTIDCELEEELNEGNVPKELKNKMYETEGISVSENITLEKNEDEWEIIDEEKKTTYIVRKENEKLNIYLKLDKKIRKKLKANLECIKRVPIEHKIVALLKQYGLEQYIPEIKKLNTFRNDVIHGNPTSYDLNEAVENEKKIKKAIGKVNIINASLL